MNCKFCNSGVPHISKEDWEVHHGKFPRKEWFYSEELKKEIIDEARNKIKDSQVYST